MNYQLLSIAPKKCNQEVAKFKLYVNNQKYIGPMPKMALVLTEPWCLSAYGARLTNSQNSQVRERRNSVVSLTRGGNILPLWFTDPRPKN